MRESPTLTDLQADIHVFLVRLGNDYVLVDAGAPGLAYEEILLQGLSKELEAGRLRLVLLTHGHIDHVGALEALVARYPEALVAFHEEEAPYLTGRPRLCWSITGGLLSNTVCYVGPTAGACCHGCSPD